MTCKREIWYTTLKAAIANEKKNQINWKERVNTTQQTVAISFLAKFKINAKYGYFRLQRSFKESVDCDIKRFII